MSTMNDVIKFYEENKNFLPKTTNEEVLKKVVDSGLWSIDELLLKLKNKANKNKILKEVEDYDLEEEYNKLNKQLEEITEDITIRIPKPLNEELETSYISNIQKIKDCDINKGPLEIWFKKHSKTNITQISEPLLNKLDEFKTIKGARCVIFFKIGNEMKAVTKFLDNEEGFKSVINIIKNPNFELLTDIEQDNSIIECSDTNRDLISGITMDMITGLRFMNKDFQYKKLGLDAVKIYCDNSGSFYHYKINECFKDCKIIKDQLLRYQITNDIKNEIFNMNCLIYALKMSGKVDDKTIQNLMLDNETRKLSQKALSLIGEYYNIRFNVKKIEKEGSRMKGIASVLLDDLIAIHDIRIISGDNGLFVAMPSRKTATGGYRDIVHPISQEGREMIEKAILEEYDKVEEGTEE